MNAFESSAERLHARAAVLLGLAMLAACRQAPSPDEPRLKRLFPELGTAQLVRLPLARDGSRASPARLGAPGHQTRPAVRLKSGEARSCQVQVRRGSRLRFAVGLERASAARALAFEVRVDGRPVYTHTPRPESAASFEPVTLPLEADGHVRIEFVGRIVSGESGAAGGRGPEGDILLASARLVPPSTVRARRVLVWISQDTLRADHLGLYGYGRATSPAIEARAADWVVFDHAMATAPWTLPSLVSQFTARYPSEHGAVLDDVARDASQPSLFQILAAEGFTVLGVTANRFVSTDFMTADGFDVLSFTPGNAAEVTRLALQAVEGWRGGDLALFVHYMDPHFPYEAPRPFTRLFAGDYRGDVNGRNFRHIPPNRARARDVAQVEALYDAEIAYADGQIDVLLDTLERQGVLEDALLVYSADHGEGFLEHGKWLHTRTLYEELLHVPLALRIPGVRPQRVSRPVSLLDLAPTVLDVFGIRRPSSFQGRSLKPLIDGEPVDARPLYAETEQTDRLATHKLAVRQGRLKYIAVARRDEGAALLREELYDLDADPAERSPLPIARAGRLPELARAYLAHARGQARRKQRVVLAPEDREALRALGYVQ